MADANGSPGPSTDRHNDPVVDPSQNVNALVDAGMDRQDDLRNMQATHLRELMAKDTAHALERAEHAGALQAAQAGAIDEKFRSVDVQLALIERMRVEQKADTQKAVDAALAAQKEAVREQTTASDREIRKSEASMTKQSDQQGSTFTAAISGVDRSISDLKDRVVVIETMKLGSNEARDDTASNRAAVLATRASMISLVAVVVSILSLFAAVIIATR